MENVIQRCDGFNHQKMAHRRSLRRGNFALAHKPQFGEKFDRIFTGATGYALYPFLTRHRLQGHRHQRAQPFLLHRGVNGHKAYGGFVIRIDIQTPNRDQISLFVHHHLVMRHRVPGIPFGAFGLVQRFTQHLPAKLVVTLQLFFCLRYSKVIHSRILSCCPRPHR